MNKYTKYISLDYLNNGEPTLVIEVNGYTLTAYREEDETIDGQFIKAKDTKYYLSGEAIEKLHELEEKDTPKSPVYYGDGYSNGELIYDMWECPNCGELLIARERYCNRDKNRIKDGRCANCGHELNFVFE